MKIALIIENLHHTTGGRYYAFFVAYAMKAAGLDITIITNEEPPFYSYFDGLEKPTMIVTGSHKNELRDSWFPGYDLYIGCPSRGSVAAINNAKKYRKPCMAMVFDPNPMLKEFMNRNSYEGWDVLEPLMMTPGLEVITLCKSMSKYIPEWLGKRKVTEINPCINTFALKSVLESPPPRQNYAIFVSRVVEHKRIDHVLYACKKNNIDLKIVGSVDGIGLKKLIANHYHPDRVKVYKNVGEEEKFKLIAGARAMINASISEGFGMWFSEAIACGTPVVCYDLPSIVEQAEISRAKNIYLAKRLRYNHLSKKLALALGENNYSEPNLTFSFENMVKRIKKVFYV